MTSKIFRSTVLVAAVVLLCSLAIILGALYGYFSGLRVEQLRDELSLAVTGAEQYGTAFLDNVAPDRFRITWVDTDGTVLFDTQVPARDMENHADREEIYEALQTGTGSSSRYSNTLMEKTLYEAEKLSDGTVLRISASQISVGGLILGMARPIALVVVIAILLSLVLANRMSKKIVEPLNSLNLDRPMENDTYEELSPLLRRINQQHEQINSQLRKLQRKTDEFAQITASMREGLVLLDKECRVLSINQAAKDLFRADENCVGRDFCIVDRRQDMTSAMACAFRDGHNEVKAWRNGREYQFAFSRIESGDKVIGLVILAIDITDSNNAEKNRREFSANVSHELKTPLQSIIGSAELLENGLVRPEDTPRFVGYIRKEASRLVLLIEDIIRLSHLDEGVEIPKEDVDLTGIVREVAAALQIAAQRKRVEIRVSGEACVIYGVRGLLYEVVHNLCDNAVKYNIEGGEVNVSVRNTGGHVVLTVADTGIGIPQEHQSRVFERFYRVDKSHSKETGGTGLGLSIVKHAVQYHNARVNLQSAPGMGTTITVTF